jgi:uncharacterized protein (TIGR03437 family)
LGAVAPAPGKGQAARSSPLSQVSGNTQLTIGGKSATIVFSGLTPGFVSLYQVNATVPADLPRGDAQVTLTVGGVSSQPGVTISIE